MLKKYSCNNYLKKTIKKKIRYKYTVRFLYLKIIPYFYNIIFYYDYLRIASFFEDVGYDYTFKTNISNNG